MQAVFLEKAGKIIIKNVAIVDKERRITVET